MSILDVVSLKTEFPTERGAVRAVDDVSFTVGEGEILGLVGESGSGKSATARSILKLLPPPGKITGGEIRFDGVDLVPLRESSMRQIRGVGVSLVVQNPMTSLNPSLTVGYQLVEAVLAHRHDSRARVREIAKARLADVGIPDAGRRFDDYPHRFSGGMRQRVLIAMGLLNDPRMLIADEPTTALDVTIQAQILNVLEVASRDRGMAVLLITHDLGVVAESCHRSAVMYAGQIVEEAPVARLFSQPLHPYTLGLLGSLPSANLGRARLSAMSGMPPDMINPPLGCRFRARCPLAEEVCETAPQLVDIGDGHKTRCWVAQRDPAAFGHAGGAPTTGGGQKVSLDLFSSNQVAGRAPEVRGGTGGAPSSSSPEVALRFLQVEKHFEVSRGLGRGHATVHAVNGVTLDVLRGESLGLVGESGCGKSTLGRLAVGLYEPSSGSIHRGRSGMGRRSTQMVFQDPSDSLDPRLNIETIVSEPIRAQGGTRPQSGQRQRVIEALGMVGLGPAFMGRHPHELSGGQQQRVGIARALAASPELLVGDEPISSLDVSQQAQVLNLLKDIQTQLDLTFLFISHDLAAVHFMSDRIAVMYLGLIMEVGSAEAVFGTPMHPYTIALRSAVPVPDPANTSHQGRIVLQGDVASPLDPPRGCAFQARCPVAREICRIEPPPLVEFEPGHSAACHFVGSFDATLRPRGTGPAGASADAA